MSIPEAYGVFSDESHVTASQFRSIAAVSLPADFVVSTQEDLKKILRDSDVSELKWNKLRGVKYRFCAIKFINYFFDTLLDKGIRADILIWDVHDSRHEIPGRDDSKNLERMYFHLHKNIMTRKNYKTKWHLRPDEKFGVDWKTIKQCLQTVGSWKQYLATLFPDDSDWRTLYNLKTLGSISSENCPLCQLADLFAGMGPYTRLNSDLMKELIRLNSGQDLLWDSKAVDINPADEERFTVISHLVKRCKSLKLGLSFKTKGYLFTYDPKNPVNYWHYTPQNFKDKAPTRYGD